MIPEGNIAIQTLIVGTIEFGDGSTQDTAAGAGDITPNRITVPQRDEVATPTIAFGDGDTGFFEESDDVLVISCGASEVVRFINVAGVEQMILPLQNIEATPSLAFGDGDTGFFESFDDFLRVVVGGNDRFLFAGDELRGISGTGPAIMNESVSVTNPTLVPSTADKDTGIGGNSSDQLSLIAGGLDCINVAETGAAREIGFYVTAPIALQTGVAVTAAGIHAALVALGLITA